VRGECRHPVPQDYVNTLLFLHVYFSELWRYPGPAEAAIQAKEAASFVPTGHSGYWALHRDWPRYTDPNQTLVGTPAVPMLMVNGTLDPRSTTDVAKLVGTYYTAPAQHYYEVPGATPGVVFTSSASPTPTDPAKPCGLDMLVSFMDHPAQGADTSCIAKVPPPDFAGDAALATTYMGTTDIWE
jgi:hypothetical protein